MRNSEKIEEHIFLKDNLDTVKNVILDLEQILFRIENDMKQLLKNYLKIHYLINKEKYEKLLENLYKLGIERVMVYIFNRNTIHFIFIVRDMSISDCYRIEGIVKKKLEMIGIDFRYVIDVYTEKTYEAKNKDIEKYETLIYILDRFS